MTATPTTGVGATGEAGSGEALDRPTRIRRALRRLVGERGFHGASMSAVAKEAGVAAGTAYVHYESKDALVLAAYVEAKAELARAAVDGLDPTSPPAERFRHLWVRVYRHLAAAPDRARFLLQVDVSPYAAEAHDAAVANPDHEFAAALDDAADVIVDLPPLVLFDLAIGPAIRLAASGETLSPQDLDRLAGACWRAVTIG